MADSRYCDRSDIEDRFGVDNVAKWADLDDDQSTTKIAARVERGIEAASDDVDDMLRKGPYQLPIQDAGGMVPRSIRRIAAQLAGVWLYEARGTEDYDAENDTIEHGLHFAKKDAEKRLRKIKVLANKIDAVRVGTSRPAMIEEDEIDADSWVRRDDQ